MKVSSLIAVGVFAASLISFSVEGQNRSKPAALHGAIAFHQQSGSIGWATDQRTARDAQVEALKQCGQEKCVVVANVSRGCAALAKDSGKFVVQKGATQQEAQTKALAKCGALCQVAAWTCTK